MNQHYDVIVIGGGIIGLATAYYLTQRKQSTLVLEQSYLGSGSTGRCISGIRAQFSTPTSIKLAQSSIELFKGMEQDFGFSVEWAPTGYLFLACDEARKNAFLKVIALQRSLGLDVRYYEAGEIKKRFPYINTAELLGGTFCPTDGQADPFKVLKGYFQQIKQHGGVIRTRTKAIAVEAGPGDLKKVVTNTGETFTAEKLVNACGPFAREFGNMMGLDLPIAPERHEALITEPLEFMGVPMLVDYRADGCYFIQRLTGQFVGCYTPQPNVPGLELDSTFEFMTEMSRRMMRLVPALESVAVVRQWSGSYSMTPDGNPIVDATHIPGLYVCIGMCGHGFMLGPALGQFLAQFMVEQKWPQDMAEFAFDRDYHRAQEALK
ncbi:FAD-binding oxidoreductase [candidate division KSB1 bacterium]|nr:FAD-binding oxidoreductase [candidate division KSB1 bacterium]